MMELCLGLISKWNEALELWEVWEPNLNCTVLWFCSRCRGIKYRAGDLPGIEPLLLN